MEITDFIHEYSKQHVIHSTPFLLDVILYSFLGYAYYTHNDLVFHFSKYFLVFILIRYFFNILTNYKKDNFNHFQLNYFVGTFFLAITLMNFSFYTKAACITIYTLLNSMIYGNTVNNIFTIILVDNLMKFDI